MLSIDLVIHNFSFLSGNLWTYLTTIMTHSTKECLCSSDFLPCQLI